MSVRCLTSARILLYVSTIHVFFFFNDTATTEIYTLSLHDALPISWRHSPVAVTEPSDRTVSVPTCDGASATTTSFVSADPTPRSEEHTSELQSRQYLVCRLLLEKKNNTTTKNRTIAVTTLIH